MPDVPSGDGTLRVRIEHDTRPEGVADLPVVLYALPEGGTPGLRGGVSGPRGELAFENVSSDPSTPYLVGVRFDEVPFGTRARFAEGESEHLVVVRISDPSPDTAKAELGEIEVLVEPACEGVQVIESWETRNPGDRVLGVREAERGGRPPIFETLLPEGAVGFAAGPGAQGLELDGRWLRFWGPLHPGTQVVDWSYGLPASAGLDRSFPDTAAAVTVRARPGGPQPSGPGLGPFAADDEWLVAHAEPGRLRLGLEPGAGSGPGAFSLERAQLWVELDDAAVRIDERYEIEPAEGGQGSLLCLPLPEGAQELRFSTASLALGLSRDPSGDLAVRGPFPPGRFLLSLRYLLPRDDGPARVSRRFPLPLPLLSIYVADTGVRADSERLHRRRPVLTDDRTYMHFEAFGVAPDEAVELRLQPVPAPSGTPRTALTVFLVLSAAAVLAFLGAPLRRSASGAPAEETAPETLEKESLDEAIRDLDHDFETGKLTPEDYAAFAGELRDRVKSLESAPRRRVETPVPAAADRCGHCKTPASPVARFCAHCGRPLPRAGDPAA